MDVWHLHTSGYEGVTGAKQILNTKDPQKVSLIVIIFAFYESNPHDWYIAPMLIVPHLASMS